MLIPVQALTLVESEHRVTRAKKASARPRTSLRELTVRHDFPGKFHRATSIDLDYDKYIPHSNRRRGMSAVL